MKEGGIIEELQKLLPFWDQSLWPGTIVHEGAVCNAMVRVRTHSSQA
jgi:hypothetical protein